jgi:hypothetical protein
MSRDSEDREPERRAHAPAGRRQPAGPPAGVWVPGARLRVKQQRHRKSLGLAGGTGALARLGPGRGGHSSSRHGLPSHRVLGTGPAFKLPCAGLWYARRGPGCLGTGPPRPGIRVETGTAPSRHPLGARHAPASPPAHSPAPAAVPPLAPPAARPALGSPAGAGSGATASSAPRSASSAAASSAA